MKIALLNYSGNVGKTTLARDMFQLNLQDHDLVTIESVNQDGKETTLIRGDDGDRIYTELLVQDNLILDIGSSNLESYLNNSAKESELISSIDMFVVPTTPEKKQQFDTYRTVADLVTLGVSKNIFLVFNQVSDSNDEALNLTFKDLLENVAAFPVRASLDNFIFRHDLYSTGKQLIELLSNDDYRSMIVEANKKGKIELARNYAKKYIQQKKVTKLNATYQKIFADLMSNYHD